MTGWFRPLRCPQVRPSLPGSPPSSFPASAGIHCVPRMALNLEVKVLFGPQGAEPIAKGNCVAAMRGGEEAGGKSGADEQTSDTKPAPAKAGGQCGGATRRWTGTPDTPSVTRTGRSGGHPEKVQCLTVGDLPGFPGEPEQGVGDGARRSGRGQQRP